MTSAFGQSLRADEGMWLLNLINTLNIDTMNSMGLKLSADDIYSINEGSLKDAVVMLGNFCTAEVVSEDGLLFTNHHCGFDAIQSHSTVEHNYLEDGFWAMNRSDELPNPDLTVTFLRRIEDVTGLIMGRVDESMSEERRTRIIETISDSITSASKGGSELEATVESLYGGNNYYLFVYETYKDVRLVGAPPSSIGKFGYDTDNWVWPRHTGDFSIFRIYSDPEGKPAEYSEDNVPLKPLHCFPISLKGYNDDDFAMVLGYPGSTDRYMTSAEVNELIDITNPIRVQVRELRQEILLEDMLADEEVFIKYADKYSNSSNYWKYSIGQNEGLDDLNVPEEKERQEKEFLSWIGQDEARQQKYGNALHLIERAVEQRAPFEWAIQYAYESFFTASEIIAFAYESYILYATLMTNPGDQEMLDSVVTELQELGDKFYKDYNLDTDMKVTPAVMRLYYENVPSEWHPSFYSSIKTDSPDGFEKYTDKMFRKSLFSSKESFDAFLADPKASSLEKDPAFRVSMMVLNTYSDLYNILENFDAGYEKGHRLYVEGLLEMNENGISYPDANFTMRLTYGTVSDYDPRDAVHYDYFTTLTGVMEKEDSANFEFAVPERLKELYDNKDYGIYGVDGTMPVCFITNNDITGGNSGSPVIDGEGNLIGLAFDGNWEAMSGDVIYEEELQRCICVDIRYVLFIIDKYAGASHLVKEMKLVQ